MSYFATGLGLNWNFRETPAFIQSTGETETRLKSSLQALPP